ncbi:hypothetical protein ACFQGX_49805 [Nonomuraea dietziae]|uniref:hypothetical protein n=1 Tax=Nonomuraea dietziae TaxID=65515 RepID=UPI0036174C6A
MTTHTGAALIGARPIGSSGVERLWGTPVVIESLDLADIVMPNITAPDPVGEPFEVIPASAVLNNEEALRAELLTSMAALAAGQGLLEPSGLELEIQVWRGGFDRPAFSVGAEAIAWCVLAASEPINQESGAIALTDPRPAGPQTAMPGLPCGSSSSAALPARTPLHPAG